MRSLLVVIAMSLLTPLNVARGDWLRLDLFEAGDDLLARDTEAELDWLYFQATWEVPSEGIIPDLDVWLNEESPWRYATTQEVCDRLSSLAAAPWPCPGEDATGLALPDVDAAIDDFGETFRDPVPPVQYGALGVLQTREDEWSVVELIHADEGAGPFPEVRVEEDASPSIEGWGHVLVRPEQWPRLDPSNRQPAALDPASPWYLGSFPYREEDANGEVTEEGVTFRVWAPNSRFVAVLDVDAMGETGVFGGGGAEVGWTAYLACQDTGGSSWCPSCDCPCTSGIWSGDVSDAWVGDRYRYLTWADGDGNPRTRRDPRNLRTHGETFHNFLASVVYDPFETLNPEPHVWTDRHFIRPRQRELVLLFARTEFLAPGDTFALDDAIAQLEPLRELGVNALQMEPVTEHPTEDTPLWYEPPGDPYNAFYVTDPMAIESSYGGPAAYKRLVDAAHAQDLAVHFSVKFNFWQDPNFHNLGLFDGWSGWSCSEPLGYFENGIYYWDKANEDKLGPPWNTGNRRPNFGSDEVQAYMSDTVRMWLDDFHVDGFYFDQAGFAFYVGYTSGLLQDGQRARNWHSQVHGEMHGRAPRVVSIAENIALEDLGPPQDAEDRSDPDGVGFDARWWLGKLSSTFTFPLSAATVSERFLPEHYRNFQQATYFPEAGDNYPGETFIYRIVEDLVASDPYTDCSLEPFLACDAAKRRLALLAALHLAAPGLPIIDVSTLFLGKDRSRPDGLPVDDWSEFEPNMWQLFKELIHLRRDIQDLAEKPEQGLAEGEDVPGTTGGLIGGGFTALSVPPPPEEADDELLAWHRWHLGGRGDDVFVVANLGPEPKTATFTFPSAGTWKVRLRTDKSRYGYIALDDEVPFPADGKEEVTVTEESDLEAELPLQPYTAVVFSQECPDSDEDGICDHKDNCKEAATRFFDDVGGDGFGNACDPDFNDDGLVGQPDYALFAAQWGKQEGVDPDFDPEFDLNGDGGIGTPDYLILCNLWGGAPGPSGLACAGSGELCTGP